MFRLIAFAAASALVAAQDPDVNKGMVDIVIERGYPIEQVRGWHWLRGCACVACGVDPNRAGPPSILS